MNLQGNLLIGGTGRRGQGTEFRGVNAESGEAIDTPLFGTAQQGDVDAACEQAAAAFDGYRALAQTRQSPSFHDTMRNSG